MPLEIRELIIRTQIITNDSTKMNHQKNRQNEIDTKAIVDQCVNKILKSLKKKMDR
ncbi:MAG: DUF5908 family protein [Saprospiraceae bacterium]